MKSLTALANKKINISAICAYGMQGEATFMLVADSNAKAKKVLAPLGMTDLKEEDVISVEMPNKAGELQKVAGRLGDAGINIFYMYGTTVLRQNGNMHFCHR